MNWIKITGKLSSNSESLRKFGITMGFALLVISFLVFLKHKHFPAVLLIISGVFFILAFVAAVILRPVYILWMKLGSCLSWASTRIILFLVFYLVFMPLGLALKLFRVDLLGQKAKDTDSYWIKKDEIAIKQSDYERQF